MSDAVRLVGISGSLRKGSFNTALLQTAIDLVPPGVEIDVAEIRDIPLYDEDVRAAGLPESVQRFRAQIANAHGVLVATPEYDYSLPGVLKNAIDWASRPPAQPFAGKPLGIMGASSGLSGTMLGCREGRERPYQRRVDAQGDRRLHDRLLRVDAANATS
jgi:chromate reductase